MDTGLRRYDGTESRIDAQIIAVRVYSKEDMKRTKFGDLVIKTLRVFHDFVVSHSG